MKITKHKQYIIEKELSDDRHNLIDIYYGNKAYKLAQQFFFKDDDICGNKWTNYEKNNSVLFIYERLLRINKIIIVKFIIGKDTDTSAIGEKYPYSDYEKICQIKNSVD